MLSLTALNVSVAGSIVPIFALAAVELSWYPYTVAKPLPAEAIAMPVTETFLLWDAFRSANAPLTGLFSITTSASTAPDTV